jgi:adenylyltransferase/sulfurtransferase
MFPEPPPPGLVPNCAEAGVLGVLPGTIGTMQATEAIKLITGIGDSMVGRMLLYDALEMSFTTIRVRKNPNCPVCGIPADQVELIDYEQFCGVPAHDHIPEKENGHVGEANKPIPQIDAVTLKQRIDNGDDLFILDVRNPEEWEITSLDQVAPVTFIPKPQIQIAVDEIIAGRKRREDTVVGRIPRDREVIVQCRSGARSTDVIKSLRTLGYNPDRLVNMAGGIIGWARNVDESMPVY